MKKLSLIISIVFIHCYIFGQRNELSEKIVVPLSKPGEVGTLETSLVNGSIYVEAYNGKEVIISANYPHYFDDECRSCDEECSRCLKRISEGSFQLEAIEEDNFIKVRSNAHINPAELVISVPKRFDLKLSTFNGGEIEVTGVEGTIEVSNVNGDVALRDIAGSILSNTVNGDLIASFRKVSKDTPMSFATLNGDVDVTLPANTKASLKMKSERGEIFSDFNIEIKNRKPSVKKSHERFKVEIETWVEGDINGGGSEYLFKNMNGNIYLRKG